MLSCPLTEETANLIDAAAIALMKPTAQLINVARGGCVDEPALIAALAGHYSHPETPVCPGPGTTPEHRDLVAREIAALRGEIGRGGLLEAVIRALTWRISMRRQQIDERQFNLAFELEPALRTLPVERFRTIVRRQMGIMMLDAEAGLAAIPQMLSAAAPERIEDAIALISSLEGLPHAGAGPEEHARLEQMVALLRTRLPAGTRTTTTGGPRKPAQGGPPSPSPGGS